jgi:hypothetical protein
MEDYRCVMCNRARDGDALRHWLCRVHRIRRGKRTRVNTEAGLMARLVFDFPETCDLDELRERVNFICNAWNSANMIRYVTDAYGMHDAVQRAPLSYADVHGMLFALISFVCRHVCLCPALRDACAERVRVWYPLLSCADTRKTMLRGERMVLVLARATGTKEFLVLADVVIALGPRLRDAAELVYAAYVRALRKGRDGIMLGTLYLPYR